MSNLNMRSHKTYCTYLYIRQRTSLLSSDGCNRSIIQFKKLEINLKRIPRWQLPETTSLQRKQPTRTGPNSKKCLVSTVMGMCCSSWWWPSDWFEDAILTFPSFFLFFDSISSFLLVQDVVMCEFTHSWSSSPWTYLGATLAKHPNLNHVDPLSSPLGCI